MKRESGVNPEQTRCCKLQTKSEDDTHATVFCMNGKGVIR